MKRKNLVHINFKKEIEKAKEYNYNVLFEKFKLRLIEENKHSLGLFVAIMSGDIDDMTHHMIQDGVACGAIDKMYIEVQE